MFATSLVIALTLAIGQTTANDSRPPHPFAPSLPQLTPKEEAKYEAIVDRFIQFDTGKMPSSPQESRGGFQPVAGRGDFCPH